MTLSLYGLQVCQGDDANRKLSSHDIKNQKLIQTVGKLIHLNMYTCVFLCMHMYVYICTCIYVLVCIYMCVYLNTCICIPVCHYVTPCKFDALQLIASMTHY